MKPLRSSIISVGSELYEISDEDIVGDPSYFGYLNNRGHWLIQKRTASAGSYRYAQGNSDYATNWGVRASLSYGYFNTIGAPVP